MDRMMLGELQKLARQFVMHNSLTAEQYCLRLIAHIAEYGEEDRPMQIIAELFLNAKPGGDGQ